MIKVIISKIAKRKASLQEKVSPFHLRGKQKIQKVRKSAFNCMHKFLKNSEKFMNQTRERERYKEKEKKIFLSVAGKIISAEIYD